MKALAQLVDDPQFDGIVGAVDDIADGGFGDAAADEELVLGHPMLRQQLRKPHAHRLIQLHSITARP